MNDDTLKQLNDRISQTVEDILTQHTQGEIEDNDLVATTYGRMVVLSALGYDLNAMATSAVNGADKLLDLLESLPEQGVEV